MTIKDAMNQFGITDISKENTESLKKKYKRLMIKYHPDNNNGDDKRAKDIVDANIMLCDMLKSLEMYKGNTKEQKSYNIVIPLSKLIDIYAGGYVEVSNDNETIRIYSKDIQKHSILLMVNATIIHNGIAKTFNIVQPWKISDEYEINCSIYVTNLCNSEKIKVIIEDKEVELEIESQSLRFRTSLHYNVNVSVIITKNIMVEEKN